MALRFLRHAASASKFLPKSNQISRLQHRRVSQYAAFNYSETVTTTLPNGLTVATENTGYPTCSIGMFLDVGSAYENASNNGVAHFLEHMAFKGTENRTRTQLELEIENMGAHLNAYTSREHTVYIARSLATDAEKVVDILSDILLRSKLPAVDIEHERGVILREMQDVENDLREVVFDLLHSQAFMEAPLGQTILGPTKNIKSLKREDMIAFKERCYKPEKMVLAGAGGINHDDLVKLAEKFFGHLPPTDAKELESLTIPECRFTGAMVESRNDSIPFCHAAIAVEGPGWHYIDTTAMMLANCLIGSWDRTMNTGSKLPCMLAENAAELGCQSFQAFNTSYKNNGLWGLYFVCEEGTANHMVDAVCEQLVSLATASPYQLERAKNLLKTSLFVNLDSCQSVCEDIGRQMLVYGRRIPIPEMMAHIDDLSWSQYRELYCDWVIDAQPAVACVGSTFNFPGLSLISGSLWEGQNSHATDRQLNMERPRSPFPPLRTASKEK